MAYNDTPLPTETPSNSQPLIRQNFTTIANSWNADHIPLSSGSNVGFSNKLTFVDQTAGPGSAASQLVEYAKSVVYANGAGTFSDLFFQRDGVGTEIQMTNGASNPIALTAGQSFLPGGLGIKWGIATINTNGNVTYTTFGLTAFPNATLNVFLTAQNNPRFYNWTAIDRTAFTINASSSGIALVSWLAIGN